MNRTHRSSLQMTALALALGLSMGAMAMPLQQATQSSTQPSASSSSSAQTTGDQMSNHKTTNKTTSHSTMSHSTMDRNTASSEPANGDHKAGAMETTGDQLSDAAITGKVKAKLLGDSRTKAFDTNVDTDGGRVTLMGTAPSKEAKMAAAELARQTDGVKSVRNQLVVSNDRTSNPQTLSSKAQVSAEDAGQSVSDSWITTKVKSQYTSSSAVKGSNISVSTKEGVVMLSGQVNSQAEHDEAVQLAQSTKGVKSVDASQLTMGSAKP